MKRYILPKGIILQCTETQLNKVMQKENLNFGTFLVNALPNEKNYIMLHEESTSKIMQNPYVQPGYKQVLEILINSLSHNNNFCLQLLKK